MGWLEEGGGRVGDGWAGLELPVQKTYLPKNLPSVAFI